MFVGFLIVEAIHSVAIEHPTGCKCRICQAAHGNREAFLEVAGEVMAQLDDRQPV